MSNTFSAKQLDGKLVRAKLKVRIACNKNGIVSMCSKVAAILLE